MPRGHFDTTYGTEIELKGVCRHENYHRVCGYAACFGATGAGSGARAVWIRGIRGPGGRAVQDAYSIVGASTVDLEDSLAWGEGTEFRIVGCLCGKQSGESQIVRL